jgi:hypothetical protein
VVFEVVHERDVPRFDRRHERSVRFRVTVDAMYVEIAAANSVA